MRLDARLVQRGELAVGGQEQVFIRRMTGRMRFFRWHGSPEYSSGHCFVQAFFATI
jgi:hypothetical protein